MFSYNWASMCLRLSCKISTFHYSRSATVNILHFGTICYLRRISDLRWFLFMGNLITQTSRVRKQECETGCEPEVRQHLSKGLAKASSLLLITADNQHFSKNVMDFDIQHLTNSIQLQVSMQHVHLQPQVIKRLCFCFWLFPQQYFRCSHADYFIP